jgi:hypothetical protein
LDLDVGLDCSRHGLRGHRTSNRTSIHSAESPVRRHVAAFPIQRPAQHGWLPALELAPGELAKLDTACAGAERCELTFEGTLKELAVSAELPTSVRFGDVRVVGAHA